MVYARKECFAIYVSLQKFEHLIRDVHFCIRTDHKNLTYLNESANRKVNGWKRAIQHYDFDIEYIPGEDNIMADGFSRLIATKEEHVNALDQFEILNLLDEFKLDTNTYKRISAVHNSKIGHFGVEHTFAKLRAQNHNWPYMREHIKKIIKQCP